MPGMGMGSRGGSAVVVLAELALFWSATLIHVLRLLAPTRLPDTDRPADAGHAVMGAGMTLMVFPGISVGTLHAAAACFAVLGAAYLARAALRRGSTQHRCQNAAIGAGQGSMAYMLAAPTHPPTWVPLGVAGVLTACAVVHGRRLIDARHRHGYSDIYAHSEGEGATATATAAPRILVTVPHIGALVMTLAMAAMVGIV
ncbi:hypothetical protein Caci_1127 [Catenulispora acidiphila DSM 44928]|uniref:Uncharacterized protein n=2 Tax=Catenulispora TaxID=414878 RepID=C7Q5V6_CATAD|nr:hypothetical protein Caci_1127 [Catenulispora acidiphila DSM 44928]